MTIHFKKRKVISTLAQAYSPMPHSLLGTVDNKQHLFTVLDSKLL